MRPLPAPDQLNNPTPETLLGVLSSLLRFRLKLVRFIDCQEPRYAWLFCVNLRRFSFCLSETAGLQCDSLSLISSIFRLSSDSFPCNFWLRIRPRKEYAASFEPSLKILFLLKSDKTTLFEEKFDDLKLFFQAFEVPSPMFSVNNVCPKSKLRGSATEFDGGTGLSDGYITFNYYTPPRSFTLCLKNWLGGPIKS